MRWHPGSGLKYAIPLGLAACQALGWTVNLTSISPFGFFLDALRYLARYVHKSAVSEARLQGYDASGNVRLNCQDSDTGKWSIHHLSPDEPKPLGRG